MKISTLSLMTPLRISTGMMLLVGLYGAWWTMAIALHLQPSGAGVRWLLLPAALLAVGAVAMQINTLGAAMRVLAARRAPCAFKRQVLRDGLLQLGLGYLVLAGSAAAHYIDPKPGVAPLAVCAILSLLACASAIATLAARRLPSAVVALPIGLALAAMASGATLPGLIAPFNALHDLTLAGLSLAWPLAVLLAALHPATPDTFAGWMAHSRSDPLWQWLTTLTRRVTFLTVQPAPNPTGKAAFGGNAHWWAPVLALVWVPSMVLTPPGGSEFDFGLLARLGLMMAALSDGIPALDLHWRGALAPGGWRAGAIGLRLWKAGACLYGGAVLLGYLLMLALDAMFDGVPLRGGLAQLAAALAETMLLVAMASALRACAPVRWVPMVVLLYSPVLPLWFSNQLPWMDALRASWAYIPLLLALTAACVALANRLWTIDKLMTAART